MQYYIFKCEMKWTAKRTQILRRKRGNDCEGEYAWKIPNGRTSDRFALSIGYNWTFGEEKSKVWAFLINIIHTLLSCSAVVKSNDNDFNCVTSLERIMNCERITKNKAQSSE